jgi:hypothetical protein
VSPVGTRLTDLERHERSVSERDLHFQVTGLATALGWAWCHWRPLQNRRGFWRTPVEGPLGQGWPDLTLLRVRDRRLIFAELKRELEQPTADQAAVLAALGELVDGGVWPHAPQLEVYLWRPSDLRDPIEDSVIGRILR